MKGVEMEVTTVDGTLGIGKIPGRSRLALYRMHGCRVDPIAYFPNEEDAEWVERFLGRICEYANKSMREP